MLAIEANDEWLVGRCYMSKASMEPLSAARSQGTITNKNIDDKEVAEPSRPEEPAASPTRRAPNSYTTSRDLTSPTNVVTSPSCTGPRA